MDARMLKQCYTKAHTHTFTQDVAGGQNHSYRLQLLLVSGECTSVKFNPK